MDGKVMFLAKKGFLNDWLSETEIRGLIEKEGWSVTVKWELYNALQKLVKEGFLGKMKRGAMKYMLAPFIKFD